MITKESKLVKKCCLYASDFHLEMILLPYIKERINESEFIIITQNDLSDTIRVLVDRVNIDNKQKEEILKLNWKESSIKKVQSIKDTIGNVEKMNIIVNGDCNYIEVINRELELLNSNNIDIIDCFNVNDINLNMNNVKNNYDEVLNTSKM